MSGLTDFALVEMCVRCGDDAYLAFPSALPDAPDYGEYECSSCGVAFRLRVEEGRSPTYPGADRPRPSSRLRRLVVVGVIGLVGLTYLAEAAREQGHIDAAANACTGNEALVQVVAWSTESAAWNTEGQMMKATAEFACVPTAEMRLKRIEVGP